MRQCSGLSIPLALALTLAACTGSRTHLAEAAPSARAEWTPWLLQASQEASTGNYAVADKLLAEYVTRFPASPEAADAMYWRALYKMDPTNSMGTPRDAAALLDAYLTSGSTAHRAEAQTLRRVAQALESASRTTAPVIPKAEVVKVEDKARDEELAHVKEELSKANAELDRIKRRLAPKP